eukprot:2428798-Rhodomonas_salina.2
MRVCDLARRAPLDSEVENAGEDVVDRGARELVLDGLDLAHRHVLRAPELAGRRGVVDVRELQLVGRVRRQEMSDKGQVCSAHKRLDCRPQRGFALARDHGRGSKFGRV